MISKMKRKNTSIKNKLLRIILFICSVVLVLMCSAYILIEYFSFRNTLENNISTLSLVIASNSTAALAFNSPRDAEEILRGLKADKNVVAACLYDETGKLFAKYPASTPSTALPNEVGKTGFSFKGKYLEGFRTVRQKDIQLGTLYIRSDVRVLYTELEQYALVAVLLILASLFIVYLLSSYLQKIISQPILALEATANAVSKNHSYSIRAAKISDDELGSLTDAFNQMLFQIEEQNIEISKAKEESSKLAAIVQSSGDAIIGTSTDSYITTWNDSAKRMFGYTEDEIVGKHISILIPTAKHEEEKELIEQVKKGEQIRPYETQMVTKNEEFADVSLTVSPIKSSAAQIEGIARIARDISKQKQTERKIVQSEAHLRLATAAAQVGIFDMDLIKGDLLWDSRCRELFGVAHDRPVSYNEDFLNALYDGDKERVTEVLEKCMDKDFDNGNYDIEYRTVGPNQKIRWVRAKGKVFFNEENLPVRFIGAVIDITDKKNEEFKKNEFISMVSHELKTPLTSIKSYVQILLSRAKQRQDEFAVNALTRTELQANKMTAMIQDFLNLARIEEDRLQLAKEIFDLHHVIEEAVQEMLLMHSRYQIKVESCEGIEVYADKDKIYQVLLNLLSNAIKYSSPHKPITVKCKKKDQKVEVFVTDQGIGISLKDQKKLFDRFYRVETDKTKNISGFGIGLFIVSEILRYHKSKIEVQSEEGKGSAFHFSLQAAN